MKRSRTCQCLQELDLPKRSRSTPDLGALKRANEVFGRENFSGNFDISSAGVEGSLRSFKPAVRSPSLYRASPELNSSLVRGPEKFVVDSILRSKGSLNEITILEHEEFFGDESADARIGVRCGDESTLPVGAVTGHMLDDPGDDGDYFYGVDSDEDDAARGDQVELDQTPDDTTDSHKTFEQSMEARTESTENLTMSIEWSAHGAVPSPVAASWCQPKNYDYVPTHSPEVERGVLGRRPACPVPINCGSNSTGGSRTSPSTLVRDKRTPVSRPWCAGLPQRGRHVAPAAPPPFTSSVSSLPSGSNTGVGNTTTLAGEKSKISTSMSTFVPRTATAASCGGGEAATEGRAWGVEHNHHRHRTRLVDGQDMVTLLSLDRLRLGSTPGRMKISPDAMWPCFPAPLVVAGEGSADCCSQSSL